MEELLIGIDAGTTNIKSVAFSLDGAELVQSSRENELITPNPGWVEQDMTATWELTATTIRDVVDALDDDQEVIGVGVTAQGDGCWLLDGDGDPVRDAILWSDGRASSLVQEWQRSDVGNEVYDICGNGLFPGASVAIFRWLAENEPDAVDETETIFHCKDWIKYRLTDELTIDPSDASLPFLDIERGEVSADVGELVGLPGVEEHLPRLAPGTEIVGHVTDEAASATGLPPGTPVVSGMIDVVASGIGGGSGVAGDSSSVVGTTSLNQTFLDEPDTDPHGVGFTFDVGVEGLYSRAMASMAGTPNLDWVLDEVVGSRDFDEIEDRIAEIDVGSEGVMYHPYLSSAGERAPFLKTTARAQFTGLTPDHTQDHLVRAVYEGVALAMRDCFEHIPETTERIYMSGGGARSDLWCELFSDCLQTPISVPAGSEFGAKGAALLAGIALDRYDGLADATDRTTTVARSYEPDPETATRYAEWYDLYCETYEAMFDLWDRRDALLSEFPNEG
jgi:sugar (pentulose or hexulose) kinase